MGSGVCVGAVAALRTSWLPVGLASQRLEDLGWQTAAPLREMLQSCHHQAQYLFQYLHSTLGVNLYFFT